MKITLKNGDTIHLIQVAEGSGYFNVALCKWNGNNWQNDEEIIKEIREKLQDNNYITNVWFGLIDYNKENEVSSFTRIIVLYPALHAVDVPTAKILDRYAFTIDEKTFEQAYFTKL